MQRSYVDNLCWTPLLVGSERYFSDCKVEKTQNSRLWLWSLAQQNWWKMSWEIGKCWICLLKSETVATIKNDSNQFLKTHKELKLESCTKSKRNITNCTLCMYGSVTVKYLYNILTLWKWFPDFELHQSWSFLIITIITRIRTTTEEILHRSNKKIIFS